MALHDWIAAEDSRSTREKLKTCSMGPSVSPRRRARISFSSSSTAFLAIAATGCRHVVVTGKYGGRAPGRTQNLFGRDQAGAIAERPLRDPLRPHPNARLGHRRLEPSLTLEAGDMVWRSDYEATLAMTERNQIPGHGRGRFKVMDMDRDPFRYRSPHCHNGKGDICRTQRLQQRLGIGQQDHAACAASHQSFDPGSLAAVAALFQDNLAARLWLPCSRTPASNSLK